jgi:leucyl-tRNA synthetase
MAKDYDHKAIEEKWQKKWAEQGTYATSEDPKKEKAYILDMFPYPSGEGLHVGHPKGYIATDVCARMKRMMGKAVLHPMGWDAFGLPAENYAIKNKVHPRIAVQNNVARFKKQLSIIGLDYDWNREINTTDPAYYKWTQWIFLKLLEKGLAYEATAPINWCPSCQTGLANEDVEADGTCERCGTKVEKRPMRQWVLKITDYADRLLAGLQTLPHWPEYIKEQQRNWIGRSEGAEIDFRLVGRSDLPTLTVFTTRPDTLFGATYLVLSPEHQEISNLKSQISNKSEVEKYINQSKAKSEIERTGGKEKTGVELKGVKAINPATKEEIPVWVADYVLAGYGTGAIMAVPAHDERDREFAEKYNLEIRNILPDSSITGDRRVVKYRLQDWVFSRQRYWGEPIPVIHCEKCGIVPVPEKDLPVTLPEVEHYEPTGTGESPLANIPEWVNVSCPKCGGAGKRETNTMPQWAGSSWYWLRFMDPHNDHALVAPAAEKHWGPVDVYVGGDHAVRHLIYARFWHKFLYDIGVVHTEEPFERLEFLGFILAEDGRKMSKRWGNVINPDDVIAQVGADSFRLYEMFMGPFENTVAWSTNGLVGARRFIERIWRLANAAKDADVVAADAELHKTIKKVKDDIDAFKFNTAISQMMIFANVAEKSGVGKSQFETFLKLLAPFAPHVAEELWEKLGHTTSIHLESWPLYDPSKTISELVTIAVQIGGKTRGTIVVKRGISENEATSAARGDSKLSKYLDFKPQKVIFVPDKVLNLVP